jgi:DNA-binding CsgD family transcriptional regulator
VLIGRTPECRQIDELLEDARAGRSGVLVLRGEAGIGKTALLDHARSGASGMTVIAVSGLALESELVFAGLADLLRPILGHLDAIPERQAAALLGALALGPPAAGDRFTIYAATHSLLGAAADARPLLVVVDDAGQLDPSSAEALAFAARRIGGEGIVVLAAIREGEPSALTSAGLPELIVTGLDRASARALLESGRAAIADGALDDLYHATGGNPLALIELRSRLTPGQLNGTEPLADRLPASRLDAVYDAEIERLAGDGRRALVVAAAAGDAAPPAAVSLACEAMGLDADALEAGVAAGLVAIDEGGVHFRHPLLREAVYRSASPAMRRAAHRAVAAGMGSRADAERRAWHMAAAAPAPDEDVAEAVEEAALGARLRGGYAVAASAFERAARLTPAAHGRAARLREAAADRQLLGDFDAAVLLLDEALVLTDDPLLVADIHRLRGRAEIWQGAPMSAHELLVGEAERIETADPERAALMYVEAAIACLMTWSVDDAEGTSRRAHAAADRAGGESLVASDLMLRHARVLRGEHEGIDELVDHARTLADAGSPLRVAHLISLLALPLIWLEQHDYARTFLVRAIDEARALSAPSALPQLLGILSGLDFRLGRWASASACAGESVRLAVETGQLSESAHGLACLVRVDAAMGREVECAAHSAKALDLADRFGLTSASLHVQAALGHLELALGRLDAAVSRLRRVGEEMRACGVEEPSVLLFEPDLVEGLVRLGRRDDAAEALADLERRASLPGAAAAAARCRALVGGQTGDFTSALELHERTPYPFERARTELVYGEHLRRARRIAEARPRLTAALEVFTLLGAQPWAERARVELDASGGGPDLPEGALATLTPQELQVSLKVAEGATNREVGAALFLSHKTVETHLGRAYRKLGVRSRAELARVFASQDALAEATRATA